MSQAVFGNRRLYCNGRIYLGNKKSQALITFVLLVTLPNLPLLFGLENLKGKSYFWISVGSVLLLESLSLAFFFNLLFSDPGIYIKPLSQTENDDTDSELKVVEYEDQTFALKFCTICKLHQPLRTYHCRQCAICVEELDHHCPWVANCIGRRNRRRFLWWLIIMLMMAGEILSLIAIDLYQEFTLNSLKEHIVEAAVFFTLFVMSIVVLILLMFQLWLVGRGLTTHERFKNLYKTMKNPFDRGCCENYYDFFTRNTRRQYVDISSFKSSQRLHTVDFSISASNKNQEIRESQLTN